MVDAGPYLPVGKSANVLFIRIKRLILPILGGLLAGSAAAAPYTPAEDAEVLERLPVRRSDPVMAELRTLRGAALARRYFELAMAEGDPRYVGYAEAALRGQTEPAADVAFVHGLLKQYRHDFDGALADFERVLRVDAEHVGARSWRAAIYMVRADYAAAREECRRLDEIASELLSAGCRAAVEGATGNARRGYEELRAALERRADAAPEIRLWAMTRLGELAARLGERAAAERHFRAAESLGLKDNYLLAAHADFLLEEGRARDVSDLLKGSSSSDTLLLRLAIAARQQALAEAQKHSQSLGERFAASALRGERLHLAEEARYLLELKGDARGALAAALENWKTQREPRDAAVLLEAALAAHEAKAAAPALRWLDESGFEGARLRRLAAQLR